MKTANSDGLDTLLCPAVENSAFRVAKVLVESSLNEHFSATDSDGETKVHYAARSVSGNEQFLDLLIKSEAADIVNTCGQTVWHVAAGAGNVQMIKRLLAAHGTRALTVKTSDPSELDTLAIAVFNDRSKCAGLILDVMIDDAQYVSYNQHLQRAVSLDMMSLFQKLFDLGADPYTWIQNGQDLLHFMTSSVSAEFMSTLLDAGLDVNLRDNNGRTPLIAILEDDRVALRPRLMNKNIIEQLTTDRTAAFADEKGRTP
jgi:uncharacterized protein